MKKILYSLLIIFSVTINAQEKTDNAFETKYRRSSLYSVMIDQPELPYAEEIKKNFKNSPIPDKFNNHNLTKRVYSFGELPTAGTDSPILNKIAKEIVRVLNEYRVNWAKS